MVVVLFQLIFLNKIKVYILLRSFAKQASSRTEQNTMLAVHYSKDFHFFKKIKSQKDKFGLRPFEPSSFSSVAPRSLLPENFLLFDSSPLKLLPFATPWPPWGWGRRRSSQLRRFIKKVGGTSSLVNSSSLFSSVQLAVSVPVTQVHHSLW